RWPTPWIFREARSSRACRGRWRGCAGASSSRARKGWPMAEPRTPFAGWSDDEVERALSDLGGRLAFPPTPDLAVAVRGATARPPSVSRGEMRRFPVRRVLAAAAIVLLALAAGLVLSGGFRSTVADWLGVRGVRIVIERETPTAPATMVAPTPSPSPY